MAMFADFTTKINKNVRQSLKKGFDESLPAIAQDIRTNFNVHVQGTRGGYKRWDRVSPLYMYHLRETYPWNGSNTQKRVYNERHIPLYDTGRLRHSIKEKLSQWANNKLFGFILTPLSYAKIQNEGGLTIAKSKRTGKIFRIRVRAREFMYLIKKNYELLDFNLKKAFKNVNG